MRTLCLLVLGLAVPCGIASAASVGYEVTDLGGNDFRYSYTFTGVTLQAQQEIDIRFDPALFGLLSNAVAPPQFDLLVLQPNNPPGSFGDYSVLSLINSPDLTGTFSVDVEFLGTGKPGSQPFFINQYDAAGALILSTPGGSTKPLVPGDPGDVPEPATLWLTVGSLIAARSRTVRRLLLRASRSRRRS
jgi:hypothetical protein